MKKISSIIIACLFGGVFSNAQDGGLDPTFGVNGRYTSTIPNNIELGNSALLTDNKIVTSCVYSTGNQRDFCLIKFLPDGPVDSSFGTNGVVITNITSFADQITSIAVQSDGKIVVGGFSNLDSSNTTNSRFSIARYNNNGTLDSTFGDTGIKLISVGNNSAISSLLIQPDGKILLGGNGGSGSTLAFVRLQTNGNLDSSFATNGIFLNTGNANFKYLQSFDLQATGKIIVTTNTASSGIRMFRLNTNGVLDLTFGTNGFATINSISSQGIFSDFVKVLADSSILLCVNQNVLSGNNTHNLYRYTNNGTLLTTTAYDPITPFQTAFNTVTSMTTQSWDNKIIITSTYVGYDGSYSFILGRLSANGTMKDNSFGSSGLVFTNFEDGLTYFPRNTFILSNGKIITIGSYDGRVGIARHNNPNSPLSVKSNNLNGYWENDRVILNWETYEEINNKGFNIERSIDGKNFKSIDFVTSKALSSLSNDKIQYSFIDHEPLNFISYYRFKQIDFDGRFAYSNIVKLNPNKNTKFSIEAFPNPVTTNLNLLINSNTTGLGYIIVYDINGRLTTKIKADKNNTSIDMSSYLPGLYFIKYMDSQNTKTLTIFKR